MNGWIIVIDSDNGIILGYKKKPVSDHEYMYRKHTWNSTKWNKLKSTTLQDFPAIWNSGKITILETVRESLTAKDSEKRTDGQAEDSALGGEWTHSIWCYNGWTHIAIQWSNPQNLQQRYWPLVWAINFVWNHCVSISCNEGITGDRCQ